MKYKFSATLFICVVWRKAHRHSLGILTISPPMTGWEKDRLAHWGGSGEGSASWHSTVWCSSIQVKWCMVCRPVSVQSLPNQGMLFFHVMLANLWCRLLTGYHSSFCLQASMGGQPPPNCAPEPDEECALLEWVYPPSCFTRVIHITIALHTSTHTSSPSSLQLGICTLCTVAPAGPKPPSLMRMNCSRPKQRRELNATWAFGKSDAGKHK